LGHIRRKDAAVLPLNDPAGLNKYRNSFSARYNLCKLVYYEAFESIVEAIRREKQIRAGTRRAKIRLITGLNPGWGDLRCSALP